MKKIIDKADSRGGFDHGWLKTKHTFSFSQYYNPERIHFGTLRVINDDKIAPSEGFDLHPHQDMEIITIPLKGYVRHGDSLDNSQVITRGEIQVMSAGTGIYHLEYNGSETEELELLQIWIFPREKDLAPRYNSYQITDLLKKNDISLFLSPNSEASIAQDAWLSWANLDKSVSKEYKLYGQNTGVYIFVVEGMVKIGDDILSRRDGIGITEVDKIDITALEDSEVIFFEVSMQ